MRTLNVRDDSPEAMLPFVSEEKKSKKESFERIPGLAYTREERIAELQKAVEAYRSGRFISHEEMGKRISELR